MATIALAATVAGRAQAAPIVTYANLDFNQSPVSFSFGNRAATFTLSSSGDIFNPAAIATAGSATVNVFGGFLGIPIEPTVNYIDRGTVVFTSSSPFGRFPTSTTIPYSNGGNILGLAFTLNDGLHVGYAEFINNDLIGYAYESTPGAAITAVAIAAPVPEPSALLLLGTGLAAAVAAVGVRRRTAVPA